MPLKSVAIDLGVFSDLLPGGGEYLLPCLREHAQYLG